MLELLFDEEEMLKRHEYQLCREAGIWGYRSGFATARIECRIRTKRVRKVEIVMKMHANGLKPEEISECTGFTTEQVRRIIDDPESWLSATWKIMDNPNSKGKTYISHKIPFDE